MNLEVPIEDHIYTTDYFQMSAFNPGHQIISIYYFVKALGSITTPLRDKEFDFDEDQMKIYRKKQRLRHSVLLTGINFLGQCYVTH